MAITSEPKYMNQDVNVKESLKKKEKDYIPEMLALTGLGLYGVDALRHGPKKANKHVVKGVKKGIENIKVPFKGPAAVAMNVGKRAVGKATPIVKAQNNAFDAFRLKKMEDLARQNGQAVKYGDKVPKDQIKVWKKEYKDNVTKADTLVNESFAKFRDEHGFKPDFEFDDLSEAEKNKFKKFFERDYKSRLGDMYKLDPSRISKDDLNMEFGFDPTKTIGGGKAKTGGFGAASGIAAGGFATGVAIGAGQLTSHALGDKYFNSKDDEHVRQLIRESYRNTDKNSQSLQSRANKAVYQNNNPRPQNSRPNGGYQGNRPNNGYQGNRPYNASQNKPYIKKEAALPPEFMKGRVFTEAEQAAMKAVARRKDNAKAVAESLIDPLIFTGGPLLVSRALNKDIKNGFVPLENPDGTGSNDIRIDVPIDSLKKKAALAPHPRIIAKGVPVGFEKVVSDIKHDEAVADFIRGRRKNLIKAVPWSIMTGLVAHSLDPRLKNQQLQNETPVPEGMARITISTAPKLAPQDESYMIKSAKNSNEDHDRTDDLDEFLKKLRKSMVNSTNQEPNYEKAVAFEPKDGITGKTKQFETLT